MEENNEITYEVLANEIEHKVNVYGNGEQMKILVNHLSSMHRTLIQSFVSKFIFPYVRRMAKNYKTDRFDARNEMACWMCYVMWEALKENFKWIEDDYSTDNMPFQLSMV